MALNSRDLGRFAFDGDAWLLDEAEEQVHWWPAAAAARARCSRFDAEFGSVREENP